MNCIRWSIDFPIVPVGYRDAQRLFNLNRTLTEVAEDAVRGHIGKLMEMKETYDNGQKAQ